MNFQEWLKAFDKVYEIELEEWQKPTSHKNSLHKELYATLLQQYTAYRAEIQTRNLVYATWALAIATIVLSVLTLILK